MIYAGFIISAFITVWAAVKLSTYADVIGEQTKLGGMLAGTLLLAGATSLPEVTTSLTAVYLNNPDIAVSNVFGSNLFNLLILAVFDLIYRRSHIFRSIGKSHQYSAWIGIMMTTVVFLPMIVPYHFSVFYIGIEMILMLLIYLIGLWVLSRKQESVQNEIITPPVLNDHHKNAISLKEAAYGFAAASVVTLIAGSFLTITGDAIAIATGLGSSFMGTFLIAGATSLPEVVAVLVAVQLGNYALAVGNILGSNMFNLLILALVDAALRGEAVLQAVHPVTLITILTVLMLTAITLAGMTWIKRAERSSKWHILPSSMVVILYGILSYLIFIYG